MPIYTFLREPRVSLKSGTGSAGFSDSRFFSRSGLGLSVSAGVLTSGLGSGSLGFGGSVSLVVGFGGSEGFVAGFGVSVGGGDLTFEAGLVLAGSFGGGDFSFSGSDFLANISSTWFVGVVGVFYIKILVTIINKTKIIIT